MKPLKLIIAILTPFVLLAILFALAAWLPRVVLDCLLAGMVFFTMLIICFSVSYVVYDLLTDHKREDK